MAAPETTASTSYADYKHRVGIHRAASSSWGDANCARLCGIIMESNNGIEQSVQENRYDLLDSYSKRQLETPDDLGLSLVFLAIQYDQPDMLEYCSKRGLDLKSPCDPMKFGNAMFYAITLKKYRLIALLDHLGCKVNEPCNDLKQLPIDIADRMNGEYKVVSLYVIVVFSFLSHYYDQLADVRVWSCLVCIICVVCMLT